MGVRILVVDDAAFIRDMVKKQLRDKIPGVELNEAIDGARALALVKQWSPDMVLSDWEMPNMSGEELLKAVRSSEDKAKLPFIMITSRGDRDHVVKAVQAGVSDYITKPFTPDELLRKVWKQLKVIGKLPSAQAQAPAQSRAQSTGFGSIDVLTASKPEPKPAVASASVTALQANPLLAKKEPAPAVVRNATKVNAQLRFPNNLTCACVIREMSLQLMNCTIDRGDKLPSLFDQAVVDIETDAGVARVNAYVHALQATENNADAKSVKIILRFVDNDPIKFEQLSKFIAKLN